MRRIADLFGLLFLSGVLFVAPAGAFGQDEIVGTWTGPVGQQIAVTGVDTFEGAVVSDYKIGPCTNAAGRVVWKLHRAANAGDYSGTFVGYSWTNNDPATCNSSYGGTMTTTIGGASGGKLSMQVCYTPGGCSTWTRSYTAPPVSTRGATAITFDTVHKDFESPTGHAWCQSFNTSTRSSNDCHVKAGAAVTFCNKQSFGEQLFSPSTVNGFAVKRLKPGQCFSISVKAGTTRIYSAIHSQMRLVLYVVP